MYVIFKDNNLQWTGLSMYFVDLDKCAFTSCLVDRDEASRLAAVERIVQELENV